MADRSELCERAEALEQLTAAAGRKRPTVADEVKMHSYTKRGCVPDTRLCAERAVCRTGCVPTGGGEHATGRRGIGVGHPVHV